MHKILFMIDFSYLHHIFTPIHVTRFPPILSSTLLLHHIPFFYKLINRTFHCGHTAFVIQCNRTVRWKTIFMLPLPVTQIAVDHHRFGRHLIPV